MMPVTLNNIENYKSNLVKTSDLIKKAQNQSDWHFFTWLEAVETRRIIDHAKELPERVRTHGDFTYGTWDLDEIMEAIDDGHKIILVMRDYKKPTVLDFKYLVSDTVRWDARAYYNLMSKYRQCAFIRFKPEKKEEKPQNIEKKESARGGNGIWFAATVMAAYIAIDIYNKFF